MNAIELRIRSCDFINRRKDYGLGYLVDSCQDNKDVVGDDVIMVDDWMCEHKED